MKKNRLIFVFATLLLGVALIFSCQKEEATSEQSQALSLKSASLDCSQCVAHWMDSKVTASGWVKWNKINEVVPNTYLETYNDGSNIYYRVYRTSGTFDAVIVNGGTGFSQVGMSTYSWQVSLAEGWKACDKVNVTVELRGVSGGTGKTNVQSFCYSLRELCPACEESFTYTANEDKSYTFTYTPAKDMIDQPVVFTFAQGTVISGLDETWSPKGGTYQKTMCFKACEPVSWTLTFTPDCSGHTRQSNVWTDFTINDISKKGTLENIVVECPIKGQ